MKTPGKNFSGLSLKKGMTTEDREKLMLVVKKAFDMLFWTSLKITIKFLWMWAMEVMGKLLEMQKTI